MQDIVYLRAQGATTYRFSLKTEGGEISGYVDFQSRDKSKKSKSDKNLSEAKKAIAVLAESLAKTLAGLQLS